MPKQPTKRQREELANLAAQLVMHSPNLHILKKGGEYPVITHTIEDHFQKLENNNSLILPELRKNNETVAIFSDYGGEHKESEYKTYSFLLCAWNKTGDFHQQMEDIRKKHSLKEKEISFKDLRFGPIKRSLSDYLNALNNYVPGILFTLIVEKEIPSIIGPNGKISQKEVADILNSHGFGTWKPHVTEKLITILHVATYLTTLLSKEKQKIFWMTDHDSIAEGEKFDATLKMFNNLLYHYSENEYEIVGGSTPFDKKEIKMLDLLSATDLTAGALEHYYTRAKTTDEPDITEGANEVLGWLAHDGIGLKKQTILIKRDSSNPDNVKTSSIHFQLKEEDPDAVIIPVVVKK